MPDVIDGINVTYGKSTVVMFSLTRIYRAFEQAHDGAGEIWGDIDIMLQRTRDC